MPDWFVNIFCCWRRKCSLCQNRRPEFLLGLCFMCNMDQMEKEIWRDILVAVVKAKESLAALSKSTEPQPTAIDQP